MTCPARRRSARNGWTLRDLIVTLVVLGLIGLFVSPLVHFGTGWRREQQCQKNLRDVFSALTAYEMSFGALPSGSSYQANHQTPWGPSWWAELLPQLLPEAGPGEKKLSRAWNRVPRSGYFGGPMPEEAQQPSDPNPNITLVAGLELPAMHCPASSMPGLVDAEAYVSAVNRELLGRERASQSLAVSDYVGIAGSAPDMLRWKAPATLPPPATIEPHGRNTRDGALGILSGSGVFPPNQAVKRAQIFDGVDHTIMIAEQSGQPRDGWYDPPVVYDLRSSWPNGAFTGAGARYSQDATGHFTNLGPAAEGVNGSGEARCFNITTVRYGVNATLDPFDLETKRLKPGIVAHPTSKPPQLPEGKPPRPAAEVPAGPGHNQGIFSAHPGGAFVLYAGGQVQFLSDQTDLDVLRKKCTRDDGAVTR